MIDQAATDIDETIVGIAHDASLVAFEPDRAYDDSQHVADLVRRALRAAGLGRTHRDSPMADAVQPGGTVLLKPNWVSHRNRGGYGMTCLVTHDRVILAVLQEVCLAKPRRVILGDAPVQSCDFDALVKPELRCAAQTVCAAANVKLDIVDFRRTISAGPNLSTGVHEEARSADRYLLFDLRDDSLLEPLSSPAGRFRVTDYDPRKMSQTHRPGRHQYLLCKEAFEADLVVSLPKLKTHSKAGLTGALKNLVGLNGNKDFLPHHRVGGSDSGGDCYPGRSLRRRLIEYCADRANMNIGRARYELWRGLARLQVKAMPASQRRGLEGSWHGNDTVWRMVLDLNRILRYGRLDGTLADQPQRRILSLTDGIVAGEGEGPLANSPKPMGLITCAWAPPMAELAHASLMGFDWRKIALIRESFGAFRYPLVSSSPEACRIVSDDREMSVDQARQDFGCSVIAPRGWAQYLTNEHAIHDRHPA